MLRAKSFESRYRERERERQRETERERDRERETERQRETERDREIDRDRRQKKIYVSLLSFHYQEKRSRIKMAGTFETGRTRSRMPRPPHATQNKMR